MKQVRRYCLAAGLLTTMAAVPGIASCNIQLTRGYIGLEGYLYPRDSEADQKHGNLAVVTSMEWGGALGRDTDFRLRPLARFDTIDQKRNKLDLQDAYIERTMGRWNALAGMRMVSWSVTETVNVIPHEVVDIINQRDLAADPAGKEKLGTPMFGLIYNGDRVYVEGYVLPYFRERLFPSVQAREHPFQGRVDLRNADTRYTSGSEQWRPGYALRVELVTGSVNAAFIQYRGYQPQPLVDVDNVGEANQLYYLVNLSAVTVQAALGSWLLKTETGYFNTHLNNNGFEIPSNYWSAVTGFEYTFIRPEARPDISAILEWMYDTRGDGRLGVQFQNDVFAGFRWVANDLFSSEAILGVVSDLHGRGDIYHAQYQRRLADSWYLKLVGRLYSAQRDTALHAFEKDTMLYAKIKYSF
ncbi:MAG TPA: hypothetical protein ENJ35_04970 [Gammaproteobacteria bacterium]|nr:hypothetical protein [Gammaproteobacteria bacterium]